MDDFLDFMRCQGVEDPEGLMALVTKFLKEPGVINEFSKAKLKDFEERLDCALAPFKDDS
jgi:hypothetical protein